MNYQSFNGGMKLKSKWVSFNGNIILKKQVPYFEFIDSIIYGGGVMETCLAQAQVIAYFDEHFNRLQKTLKYLYPKALIDFDRESLEKEITELLLKKGLNSSTNKLYRIGIKIFANLSQTRLYRLLDSQVIEKRENPIKLLDVVDVDEPLILDHPYRKHKLTSYSPSWFSQTLYSSDKDIVVYNKKNEIIEAGRANLGLILKDTLYLIQAKQNILPGIIQKQLIKNHSKWFSDLKLLEGFPQQLIDEAEEMLYLNSTSMCLAVARFIREPKSKTYRNEQAVIINNFLFNNGFLMK